MTDSAIMNIKSDLSNYNWDVLSDLKCNEAYDHLLTTFLAILNKYAPEKTKIINSKNQIREPWMTPAIFNSCKRINRLYRKCMRNNKESALYEEYVNERNKINYLKRKVKYEYYVNKIYEFKNEGKKMWSILNDVLGKHKNKHNSIAYININGIKSYNKRDIANEFCKYFSSVGATLANKIPKPNHEFQYYVNNKIDKSIYLEPTNCEEIKKIITNLKNKTSHGHDKINNQYLKLFKTEISVPLEIIFNKSIIEGTFPESMKQAHIIPIYKTGSKSETNNYRPVALLSCISKILEKIIHKRLYKFWEKIELFNPNQYGFRPQRNTSNAISAFIGNILNNLENNEYTIGLLIDFSKAFDTIDHSILLHKLNTYGIRGVAYKWMQSYLSNRTQSVRILEENSNSYILSNKHKITHGVPQGSILGPLLFIIYINDMDNSIQHGTSLSFADDTTVIIKSKNFEDTYTYAYEDIVSILDWCNSNKLSLNLSKTNYILYSPKGINDPLTRPPDLIVNNIKVEKVEYAKFLGIYIDSKLNWEYEVNNICNKLTQAKFLLNTVKNFLPDFIKKMLYYAHVYSHINYGITLWGPMITKKQKQKIITQQNKIISTFNCSKRLKTNNKSYKHLQLLKFENIIDLELGKLMYSIKTNSIPEPVLKLFQSKETTQATYNTRNRNIPNIRKHKSKKYNNSFMTKSITNWTHISNNIKNSKSVNEFKNRYKKSLIQNY
jgi:endonuclease V-like protein UPF0215 family